MKKRKQFILSTFLLVLSIFLIVIEGRAQAPWGYIDGPTVVCVDECPTYTYVNLDLNNPPLSLGWGINNYPTNIPPNDTMNLCSTGLQNLPPWTWDILLTLNYSDTTIYLVHNIDIVEAPPSDIIYSADVASCPLPVDTPVDDVTCQKICVGSTSTYCSTNQETGEIITANWEVIGATNILSEDTENCVEVEWGEVGFGTVTDNSACGGTTTICVEVLALPEASISSVPAAKNDVITICQGQEVQFQSTSSYATTFLWNFGFETSEEEAPSVLFNTPGTHEISLIAYNECLCADETTLTVEVIDATSPILSCVSTVCVGDVVTYTADMECTSYDWSVGANGNILEGGHTTDDYITIE